jgi:hypothetical protein
VALESLGQGMEGISALLAQGVKVRADDAEGLSTPEGAKAARDLLLDLGHAHGWLGSAKGSPPSLAFKTVHATLAAHGSSVDGALVMST